MERFFKVKSTLSNFKKELLGTKPCTVRFTDDWDEDRWKDFKKATRVEIVCNPYHIFSFSRRITDKTVYKNVAIISWRP